ncbi:nickel-dependent hydrogenase large subunit [Desulfurobacterium atlanticum]|uniref:Coenzyme F420-reducing hydrogenase, alpha subunit n=1 Tax=Desulfurobacterium atlanticum TaxID=240169 RepID=A0A238ZR03_9BACT|nr:nickel-dependent hydrogenase large subunit [Desulfurobacterium atlanticum]SNR85770.1 coenzyme F420-reducing hydrogenase, alpha subunit [Desulfurobacterium atlanticum]
MIKKLEIEPIPLTEGHSKLVLKVEDGIITEGFYYALVPVRGFETMLLDKEATFAPIAASRICGMCQAVHSIAVSRAVENACQIEVPEKAKKLREVINLSVRVYNHLLHHILISGNIFKNDKERFEFIKSVQKIRKTVSSILEIVGGGTIHPSNIVIGGISSPIENSVKERLLKMIEEIKSLAETEVKTFIEYIEKVWKERNLPETLGKHNLPFFSLKDLKSSSLKEIYPQEIFEELPLKREATNTTILINGKGAETGARARKVTDGKFKPKGGIKELHILRAQEIVPSIKKIEEILEKDTFEKEIRNPTFPTSDNETVGIGAVEAPRGVNIHKVKVDKSGRITYYKVMVPTAINMIAIAESLKGERAEYAEIIVRAYDPCIACSTH